MDGEDEERELPVAGDSISHVTEEEQEQDVSVEEDLGPNALSRSATLDTVCGLHQKTAVALSTEKTFQFKHPLKNL